jgi:DNA-binding protein Fis
VAKSKKPTAKQQLAAVRKALEEYYADLDARANTGEFMMTTCLSKIEKALDMRWGKDA